MQAIQTIAAIDSIAAIETIAVVEPIAAVEIGDSEWTNGTMIPNTRE